MKVQGNDAFAGVWVTQASTTCLVEMGTNENNIQPHRSGWEEEKEESSEFVSKDESFKSLVHVCIVTGASLGPMPTL